MKPVFDKEAVEFLGYQEYYPELKDWLLGIFICLTSGFVIVGLAILLIKSIEK